MIPYFLLSPGSYNARENIEKNARPCSRLMTWEQAPGDRVGPGTRPRAAATTARRLLPWAASSPIALGLAPNEAATRLTQARCAPTTGQPRQRLSPAVFVIVEAGKPNPVTPGVPNLARRRRRKLRMLIRTPSKQDARIPKLTWQEETNSSQPLARHGKDLTHRHESIKHPRASGAPRPGPEKSSAKPARSANAGCQKLIASPNVPRPRASTRIQRHLRLILGEVHAVSSRQRKFERGYTTGIGELEAATLGDRADSFKRASRNRGRRAWRRGAVHTMSLSFAILVDPRKDCYDVALLLSPSSIDPHSNKLAQARWHVVLGHLQLKIGQHQPVFPASRLIRLACSSLRRPACLGRKW